LESGPSNPVGFFTLTISRNAGSTGYSLISIPTLPSNASFDNAIGAQLPGSTTATFSTNFQWYNSATANFDNAWYHVVVSPPSAAWATSYGTTMSTLDSRKGYYVVLRNRAGVNLSYNVVIAGDVRTTAWDMGTINVGYNMVGSVFAAPVSFANSNIMSGTTRFTGGSFQTASDNVVSYDGTNFLTAWYKTNGATPGWQGPFSSFDPGKGYFIVRKAAHSTSFAWPDYPVPTGGTTDSYNPISSGTTVIANTTSDTHPVTPVATSVSLAPTKNLGNATTITAPAKVKPSTVKAK
jgi:hypothetical protein